MIQITANNSQFILRCIQKKDLAGLHKLTMSMRDGLTSLPNDKEFLSKKIEKSVRAFETNLKKPGKEHYLFVLEELKTKTIAGVCGIYASAGGADPLLCFRIRYENIRYKPLGIYKELKILQFEESENNTSELCSLYMHPDFRKFGQGRLLALSRYLYMAINPKRFNTKVLAELRGYRTKQGKSPFWTTISKPFFNMPLKEAETVRALRSRSFIKSILPHYPIHVCMLPPTARVTIGRVHNNTRPAKYLLESEGLKKTNQIDVFDGGPFYGADLNEVRFYKEIQVAVVSKIITSDMHSASYIIANNSKKFKACLGHLKLNKDNTVTIPNYVASNLKIKPGDHISFAREHPKKNKNV